MLRDAAGGNLCGACRAGPGDGFGCGRARAAGRRRRARRGVVREHHGARPRRPDLRRRAGGAAEGDQGRRAALGAVPDRAGDLGRGARAARRDLRPRLRDQPLRLRLLHGREPGREPRRAVHGERGQPRRGRPGQRAGDRRRHPLAVRLPQRWRAALLARRQALLRGRREPQRRQRPEPQLDGGQAAPRQPRRLDPVRQPVRLLDLGARAAQPVHVRHRARDGPDLHQRRRPEHVRGDRRGVDELGRPQLRLAHDRGPDDRLALQDAVPLLHARVRPVRDHRRRVLRPGDGELPLPVRGRLLLRRLLRRLDQGRRPVDQGRVDAADRLARAGRHRRGRGRQPLLPRARGGPRPSRAVRRLRDAAVDLDAPAAGDGVRGRRRDVHRLRRPGRPRSAIAGSATAPTSRARPGRRTRSRVRRLPTAARGSG